MEALYEESAVNAKSDKGAKLYNVVTVLFWVFLILCVIFVIATIYTIPVKTPEVSDEIFQGAVAFCVMIGCIALATGGIALTLFALRRRINVSYDYSFVSGELRISKVFNLNHRKLLYRIESENILQIGDVENGSYATISSDPTVKEVVCTPNIEAAKGKFFMYIYYPEADGRKAYILECREELLVNILRFAKRGTLERDYVQQEKKQAR